MSRRSDCTSRPIRAASRRCTIGGNVANNSGGPHCLADGVTSSHILAVEVVLPDGSVAVLGGEDPEPTGYDLRGAFVGSEGMCGIATAICVRLTPNPPVVRTMLLDFPTVDDGAATVSGIIAAGIVPAALEMMDQLCLQAVEGWLHCGLPVHSAAALLVEVVGETHAVDAHTDTIIAIARERHVRDVRIAADEAERALLWKGRKSAFGAIARIKPNYYLHDTVVPRHALPAVLAQVYEIAARHDLDVLNVFHAGDGNLHPLLLFDAREPGVMERVLAAGDEIVAVSVAAGGVLSGEHGIGLEKRRPDAADVRPGRPRRAGRVACGVRPGRARRTPARCCRARRAAPTSSPSRRAPGSDGAMDLARVRRGGRRATGPVTIAGSGSRGGPVPDVRCVHAPSGIDWLRADEMTVCCGAGTTVAELDDALVGHGQCVAIPPHGTVGGALAVGRSGLRRLGYGPVRDTLLQARYVSAAGDVVKAGGPTVKNVTGFDLCRLLVGSHGTLGFLGEVILRTRPRAALRAVVLDVGRSVAHARRAVPADVRAVGRVDDVGAARGRRARRRRGRDGARPATGRVVRRGCRSGGRWSLPPSRLRDADGNVRRRDRRRRRAPRRPGAGAGGRATQVRELHRRLKHNFDPDGRLNPGVDVLDVALTGRSSTGRRATCRPRRGSPSVSRPTSACRRRCS